VFTGDTTLKKNALLRVIPHAFGTRRVNNSYGGVETYMHY
jgi:hypothetical protein